MRSAVDALQYKTMFFYTGRDVFVQEPWLMAIIKLWNCVQIIKVGDNYWE